MSILLDVFTNLVDSAEWAAKRLTVPGLLIIVLLVFVFAWYNEIIILGKTHRRVMTLFTRSVDLSDRKMNVINKLIGKDE